jgi:flagellar FliJ protein
MKAFEFTLQKLLDLKNSQLELLKLDISKTILKIDDLKKRISEMNLVIKNAQDKMEGTSEISFFKSWMNYIQSLYAQRQSLLSNLLNSEKALDQLKESYVSIYREKKAFENLKSIQKSQYDLEKLKEDQKIIDEIGMQKHIVS